MICALFANALFTYALVTQYLCEAAKQFFGKKRLPLPAILQYLDCIFYESGCHPENDRQRR